MRNEQIKAERRRRNSASLSGRRMRLAVNEETLDREKYAYRFVNNEGNRLYDMTVHDDWEIVPDRAGVVKDDASAIGASVSTLVGTQANGAPLNSVLCRKLKTYYEDDQIEKARIVNEKEASLKGADSVPGAGAGEMYVPTVKTRITHGDRNSS